MPPKAKITREMIVEAGLQTVRTEGQDSLNVRKIASLLDCSTQPVMYHFRTMADLKAAVYVRADEIHTAFIMAPDPDANDPFLSIGLRYIQFAADEKNLFRFLFQSGQFQNTNLLELLNSDALEPLTAPLRAAAGLSQTQTKEVFAVLFTCVHGAASMIANNSVTYDKAYYVRLLSTAFSGTVDAVRRNSNETL